MKIDWNHLARGGCQTEQSGKEILCERADQGPNGHSGWAPKIQCGDGRNFQKDDHHCSTLPICLYGRAARWKPLLNEMNLATKGLSDCGQQDSLVWWNQGWTVQPHFLSVTCGGHQVPHRWNRGGWEKAQWTEAQQYTWWKLGPEHSGPQTGQKIHLLTGQWT